MKKNLMNTNRHLLTCFVLSTFILLIGCKTEPEKPTAISSGLSDIDQIRTELSTNRTNVENIDSRRAALFRWFRLLWRQGLDLDSFDETADILVNSVRNKDQNFAAIDSGFLILERILLNPKKIPEIKSKRTGQQSTTKTNWPFFFGTQESQRGYSPDAGPSKGEIAWKYPKGYYWNAAPKIENGKIYASSPGIDVVGLCLDEKTGKTIWRGRQNGIHFYGAPTPRWSPIISDDYMTVRCAYTPETIRVFDKSTGKLMENPQASAVQNNMVYIRDGKTLVLANANTGEDAWIFETENYFSGEPILDGQSIYTADRNGTLYKFDISANTPVWTIELQEKMAATPTLIGETVYVGTKSRKLYSIATADKSINWTFETPKAENKANQFFSGVTQVDDKLYVGAANKELYCLDSESGKLIWKEELSDWIRSKPLAVNGMIYVATLDSKVYGFEDKGTKAERNFLISAGKHGITADLAGNENGILAIGRDMMMYSFHPEMGELQWSTGIVDGTWVDDQYYFADWNGGLLGSPTVVDDIVYFGGPDGFVNALDSETGKELWRFETNSTVSIAPTVAEGKVFFGYLGATTEHYGFDNPGEYWAVDKNTGEPVWSSNEFARVWVGAAYSNGILCMGDTDGNVYGVNPEDGSKLWEYWTGKNTSKEFVPLDTPFVHGYPMGVYSVPTSDDKNFYTGSWSGYYYAFDQKTGKLVWRCETKGNDWGGLPDSAAPTLWKNHLYVQKKGGLMAAINIESGEIEWEWWAPRGHLYNATPAANNNLIYGAVTRKVTLLPYTGKMVAFKDVENGGEMVWEQMDLGGLTAPVLTDDQLITGSSNGMFITSLNPETGEILWRTFTGGEMTENVPAIYGNKVYALCKNGYLFALE
ncbi:MAG: PQQ-binding-like beta-propeller repeat protein [Cyclobacteriaceae bacterium]